MGDVRSNGLDARFAQAVHIFGSNSKYVNFAGLQGANRAEQRVATGIGKRAAIYTVGYTRSLDKKEAYD